jgi:poly(3-hydroxybutyrate) depolymerase
MLLLLLACAAPVEDTDVATMDTGHSGEAPEPESASWGSLACTNSADRRGWYFRPEGWNLRPVDVVVLFHGTGGSGETFADQWQAAAEERGIALVAPDSRVSPGGQFTWEVGGPNDAPTEDVVHALACLEETLALGVEADRIVTAGFSGGGSSAPYHASLDGRFTGFGSLHGGVFPTGLGDNEVRGWFSTGEDDTLRPPDMVQDDAKGLQLYGWTDVTVEIFAGGHNVSTEERGAFLDWAFADD